MESSGAGNNFYLTFIHDGGECSEIEIISYLLSLTNSICFICNRWEKICKAHKTQLKIYVISCLIPSAKTTEHEIEFYIIVRIICLSTAKLLL